MFFVQGTGSSVIGTYELAGVRCASCNAPGAVAVTVYSRYAHLFWIPLFPFRKVAVSQCNRCEQTLEQYQWPAAYQEPGQELIRQARLPLTNFAGLLLIALLLLWDWSKKRH